MADHDIEINSPGSSGVINDLRTIFALIQQIRAAGRGTGIGVGGGPGGLGGAGFGPAGRGGQGIGSKAGIAASLAGLSDITRRPPRPPSPNVFNAAVARVDAQLAQQMGGAGRAGGAIGGTAAKVGRRLAGTVIPGGGKLTKGLTGKMGAAAATLWAGEEIANAIEKIVGWRDVHEEEEKKRTTAASRLLHMGERNLDLVGEANSARAKALKAEGRLPDWYAGSMAKIVELSDEYLKARESLAKNRMFFKTEEEYNKFVEANMIEYMRGGENTGIKRKIMLHDAQSAWYQERFVTGPHRDDVGGS